MAHQYLNDGEEEEVRSRPANEPERHDGSHEDVPVDETSTRGDDQVTASAAARRQRSKQGGQADKPESQRDVEPEVTIVSSRDADMHELESRGFTQDEATRLIDLSVRINEVTLKRLQFTKWLVDQGLLDEFSLRD